MTMRRNTKPDAPKALAKGASGKLKLTDAGARIETAMTLLIDALSAEPKIDTVVAIQAALKSWTKRMEDVEKISKGMLIEHLKAHGKATTEKGSLSAHISGYQVEARPWRTGLEAKKVEALLRAKELSVDTFMDKDIKYLVNETRLASAVDQGYLTNDELDTCRYELSYALQPIKKVGNNE